MNEETLRRSLRFGDGQSGNNKGDIGKFGMGLPNASLSQCQRVEVYSWQSASEIFYSYIDTNEIKTANFAVPKPQRKQIPDAWKKIIKTIPSTGTLVIWSKLDKLTWKKSKTMKEQSKFLIGRIYRHRLIKNLTINLKTIQINNGSTNIESEEEMLANDPLYLIAPSSTPGEWGEKPMFHEDTNPIKFYTIKENDQDHVIKVTFSLVKNEVRDPKNNSDNVGSTPHGKHAKKNQGVSIIRSAREIDLDTNLVISYDPRERWWGVEIDLPESLDGAVGLTNNKQTATVLSDIFRLVERSVAVSGEQDGIESDLGDDPVRIQLFSMSKDIVGRIRSMRNRIKMVTEGSRSKDTSKSQLDKKIDIAITKERNEGEIGTTDEQRKKPDEQRIETIAEVLVEEEGLEKNNATEIAIKLVDSDRNVRFSNTELSGSQFFDVQNLGGILYVKINEKHSAYKNLLSLTESQDHQDLSCEDRLVLAHDGLKLLLVSWAQLENLTLNDEDRKKIQDVRINWGKRIEDFCVHNEI